MQSRRSVLALAATSTAVLAAPAVHAQSLLPVRFSLDWAFQGPQAAFLLALERGYFRREGLAVTMDRGFGSGDVPVKIAGGSYDVGVADLNPTIRMKLERPEIDLFSPFLIYDATALAVMTVRREGITRPAQLLDKTLAAPESDSGRQLFPAFAKSAGIDASKVTFLSVSPALREPMLVRREADGVTGFVTTSALALKGIGLDHPAQRVMMYYDHGLNLYGGAILTTRAFIERNPAVVRGAVAALMRGFRDTLRNGQEMLDNLKRVEPLTDVALERERHEMNVARVIMSDHVRANGLSSVDMGRLQTGIRAVEEAYNLQPKVQAAQIYTPDFLPPAADRAV